MNKIEIFNETNEDIKEIDDIRFVINKAIEVQKVLIDQQM
jgi:hypothetical protein